MSKNDDNNRVAEMNAEASLNRAMSGVQAKLSESFDVVDSTQLPNAEVLAGNLKNGVQIYVKAKQNVYGNRFYQEGEDTKFGSVKVEETEKSETKKLLLFKKGSMSTYYEALAVFARKSQDYYTVKSIKGAKKPPSQALFNFYRFLIVLDFLSVLFFVAMNVWAIINSANSPVADTLIPNAPGGAKTIWLSVATTAALSIICAIIYGSKISSYRPTDRGMGNTSFTMHSIILLVLELLTMFLSEQIDAPNILYFIGFLYIPAIIACAIYPIVMLFFLGLQSDSFDVKQIMRKSEHFSKEEYAELSAMEKTLLLNAVVISTDSLRDFSALANAHYGAEVSVTRW